MNKFVFALCLSAGVCVISIGSQVLADTVVLRPTSVDTSIASPGYVIWGNFGQTIDNTGLSAVVDSGVAPTTWATAKSTDTAGNFRTTEVASFCDNLSSASLVYHLDTSVAGHNPQTINSIVLWQMNVAYPPAYYNDRDIGSALVRYSTDGGATWSLTTQVTGGVTGKVTFTANPASSDPTVAQTVAISGLPTGVNAIKLDTLGTCGDARFLGFNEIRFVGDATLIPEPGTVVLLITGLIGLLAYAWRRRK